MMLRAFDAYRCTSLIDLNLKPLQKIACNTAHHLKIVSLLGLCIPPHPSVLTVEFSKVSRAIGYIRPWSHARLNRATLVPHRTLLPSFGLHILRWMGLFNSKICKEMYANPIGLSANWWYSKVMMTVYDSVTKETLDHQPSHLSSNFGVSLRRVFVTTNWGWQAMTSNDLIDSWVMYSAPSWEWRSSRTLGFCEIKRVVDMCSCHKCYILYKAYYKDSTLEYYIVVALSCCRSVPILLSKKYHSNVNTMELWGLQEPQTLLPRRDSASSLMA